MSWRIVIALMFASAAMAQEDTNLAIKDAEGVSENDREGKFFSVFQIVKFKNGMCTTSTGDAGTCYTEAECAAAGGTASGPCASSFGVCCMFVANTCGSTVNQNNSYIQSPNYPAASSTGMCMFNIEKCDSNICQYKLTFEDFMLSAPMMGDCTNDTMMFSGLDSVSQNTVPPTLCGDLTGHEMYVTVKSATAAAKIVFNIASMASNSRYKIKVEQLSCADTDILAPAGCVTYSDATSGSITSFNNANGAGEMINNQKFCHCIKYQDGFCDVSLTASNFDLDSGDSLTFGNVVNTGSTFGTSMMLNWNFTGPYCALVESDDMNTAMNGGYSINYLMLPCA